VPSAARRRSPRRRVSGSGAHRPTPPAHRHNATALCSAVPLLSLLYCRQPYVSDPVCPLLVRPSFTHLLCGSFLFWVSTSLHPSSLPSRSSLVFCFLFLPRRYPTPTLSFLCLSFFSFSPAHRSLIPSPPPRRPPTPHPLRDPRIEGRDPDRARSSPSPSTRRTRPTRLIVVAADGATVSFPLALMLN